MTPTSEMRAAALAVCGPDAPSFGDEWIALLSAFRAIVSPHRVLALLDEVEALRARVEELEWERDEARKPKFIRCGHDLTVNRDHILSAVMDRRHYANGPGSAFLVLDLTNGVQHRIEHTLGYFDGVDCYEIKREIENA